MPEPRPEAQHDIDSIDQIRDAALALRKALARVPEVRHVQGEAFRIHVRATAEDLIAEADRWIEAVHNDDLQAQLLERVPAPATQQPLPFDPALAADVTAAERGFVPLGAAA